MSYSVRILPLAKADRRRAFRFIEDRSPQGAENWETAYEKVLTCLEETPLIYGIAPESEHFDYDLRQALFSTRSGRTYRLIFRVDRDQVTVYRLRGPGQDTLSVDDLPNG